MEGLLETCKRVSKEVITQYENAEAARDVQPAGTEAPEAVQQLGRELFSYAEKGNAEELSRVLEGGAPPDWTGARGRTPLLAACYYGHDGCVSTLLASHAQVNLANDAGVSPLLLAAALGHSPIVKMLIDAGADVQHRDESGKDAGDWARQNKHKEVLKLLDCTVDKPKEAAPPS